MKKKIIIIISIILLVILLFPIKLSSKGDGRVEYRSILYKVSKVDFKNTKGTIVKILGFEVFNNVDNKDKTLKTEDITWDEITEKGIDEKKLMKNVDTNTLEEIATLFQELTREIKEKERKDPKFAFSAGWYNYTLESSQFKKVLKMGNKSLKPLYLIVYKSPNEGLYEYICCMAIDKISKIEVDNWNTSKDFLEKFNKEVLKTREK